MASSSRPVSALVDVSSCVSSNLRYAGLGGSAYSKSQLAICSPQVTPALATARLPGRAATTETHNITASIFNQSGIRKEKLLETYDRQSRKLPQCRWARSNCQEYLTKPKARAAQTLEIILTTVNGETFYLDDPCEYHGTYAKFDRYLDEPRLRCELIDEAKLKELELEMEEASLAD
ncbi:hypothetical protein QBC43DRAFT_292231 [Cladorrhinum sp. PSN259]|nr:hypothetical protein QBC43DRAFT_292231 [Cladorrhinum sp. PSN259]